MSDYVDPQIIEGLRVEITQQLAEAIEFSVNRLGNEGEDQGEVDRRQTAQDAVTELTAPLVDAFVEAYRKSPIQQPDYEAVSALFQHFAIKARLLELMHGEQNTLVTLITRKGSFNGSLKEYAEHEGEEAVNLVSSLEGSIWIPVISITGIEV